MARKKSQKALTRDLIDGYVNSYRNQMQKQAEEEMAKNYAPALNSGMSKDEIDTIINSYKPQTQEIPKLEEQNTTPSTTAKTPSISEELERMKKAKADTTTPRTEGEQKAIDTYYNSLLEASGKSAPTNTPTTNYKAEIERMNALKADTTAQRTEGENQAIDTYLNGLIEAQRYLDSQKPKTTVKATNKTTKKDNSVKSKNIGTVEIKADGTRNYTKTMSANEQRDYERALQAQAKAVGREAKKNANPKDRVLSPNEQRDLERATNAIERAKEKEKVTTETGSKVMPTTAKTAPETVLERNTLTKAVAEATPSVTPTPTASAQNLFNGYAETMANNGKMQELTQFVDDANETLRKQQENALNPKIDDSKWLVKKDELDALMQNPEFAKDMETLRKATFDNANQDATVMPEYAEAYFAPKENGGMYSKSEYYKLLEDKYGLNPAQLNDVADTMQYYQREEERAQAARDFQKLGEEHPVIGTLGSYAGTAGSGIEGMWNTGLATLTGDPRTQSHLFDTTKNELRAGVTNNFDSNFMKNAYQMVAGLGDLGVGLAMGNAPLVLAGNTAGEATTSAIERGSDVNKAGLYGTVSGIADYYLNKVGLDKAKDLAMDKLTKEGTKQFLKRMGVAGGIEGAENVLQDGIQMAFDELINGSNSENQVSYAQKLSSGETPEQAFWNVVKERAVQLGVSFGTGALMGAGMQGGKTLANSVEAGLFNRMLNENSEIQKAKLEEWRSKRNKANDTDEIPYVEASETASPDTKIPEMEESQNPITGQVPAEVNPDDVIYHSGILSRLNKADSAGKMEGTRDTGYYGTGHYFVDQAHKNQIGKGTGYGNKPYSSVDISKYNNLFKADTDAKANELHDFSQRMMRFVNGHNDKYFTDSEGINADSLKEYMDDMYSQYRELFGDNALDRNAFEARLNDFRNNYRYDFYNRGDSAFTTFMKEHGYNGVDTRGTNSANVERGIVIYDLDEDSVLQSNVTDEAVKNGLMNTRVRNGNPVFDADTDARIQKEIDAYNRRENVRQEYNRIYDDTKLREAENEVDRIENRLNELKNDAHSYYYSLLNDEGYLNREARQRVREAEEWGLDTTLEEEKQILLDSAKEGLAEVDEQINTLNSDLEKAKSVLDAEEKLSNQAMEQARKNIEGTPTDGGSPTPPDEPPGNNNVPNNPDRAESRVLTRSLVSAGHTTPDEIRNNPELREMASHEVHHNDEIRAQAEADIQNNGEEWKKNYVSGDKKIDTDSDVDRGMVLLEKGNLADHEKNSIFRNMVENGTKAGEFIQAFAKYANTKTQALLNATKIDIENTKKWASRNKASVEGNNKFAKALSEVFNETTTKEPRELTIEDYRNRVRKAVANEPRISEAVKTDADIDYLANMYASGASTKEIADALNTKMATGRFGITEETQQYVNDMFEMARQYDENSRQYVEAQAEAFRALANEVAPDATALEKFDAWRYMAMLGNPKTMLRNFVGNKLFSVTTGISNNLAALIEAGADRINKKNGGIQRTKAVLNPIADKELITSAKEDGINKRWRDIDSQKYEKMDKETLKKYRSVFKSTPMQLAEKAVDAGISDTKAVLNKYGTSLAGYMKANGLTKADIDASYRYDELYRKSKTELLSDAERAEMNSLADKAKAMEKARDYALKQAEYATFHEDNEAAQAITNLSKEWRNSKSKVKKLGGYVLEGVVPFKKTPANILRSGLEYSPLGLLKSIADTGKLTIENTGKRKENWDNEYTLKNPLTKAEHTYTRSLASDVIDSWAKGLTGSGLTVLGYYLFNKGILKSSDKDTQYQDQLEGRQNYSIEINGHNYTIDWASPSAMPLLLGAEISKVFRQTGTVDKKFYDHIPEILQAVNTIAEPIVETSMLQGVKDAFETAGQAARSSDYLGMGTALAYNALTGYASQAIPTAFGQIARVVDPVRRSTYSDQTGVVGILEKQAKKNMNKIPFLSMLNQPYYDARGDIQYNSPFEYATSGYDDRGFETTIPTIEKVKNIGRGLGNFLYQTGSVGYYDKANTTDADKMAWDIYNTEPAHTGEKPEYDERGFEYNAMPNEYYHNASVFAERKSDKKINGEKVSEKDYATYSNVYGQTDDRFRENLAHSDWFNSLDRNTQGKILGEIDTLADDIGESAIVPGYQNDDKLYTAYKEGGVQGVFEELEAKHNQYGLSTDAYKEAKENGELQNYEGYGQALEQNGIKDTSDYRKAYASGGTEGLQKEIGYQNSIKEYGLTDSDKNREAYDKGNLAFRAEYVNTWKEHGGEVYDSESAKNAYFSKKYDQYAEYRKWLKDNEELETALEASAKEYGMKNDTTSIDLYNTAKSNASANKLSLTPEKFATTFKSINQPNKEGEYDNKLTQTEIIAYLNDCNITSEKKGKEIWNVYLTDSTTATIPVLEKGEWKTKRTNTKKKKK